MNETPSKPTDEAAQAGPDAMGFGHTEKGLNGDLPGIRGAQKDRAPRSMDGLGFVMDVPVELTVEIGRKTMRIAEILKLGPGSVLELDKSSGESLDILANGRLIARGEAVVVGERYGVRLTEVLVLNERAGGIV